MHDFLSAVRARKPEEVRDLIKRLLRQIPKRPPAPSVKRRGDTKRKSA
jgi:hypothetical protein